MCRALVDAGVDVLFGYPGGAIMPFYHALPEFPALRHILVRHEQAAAHAADGYARASGRVGVCVATSGPGATNLVTGLATAHMDSSPVVAINRAIAVAETRGPAAGLAALDVLTEDARLSEYQPYWAARAGLLERADRRDAADQAYQRAIGLESDPAVRRFLQQRRAALSRSIR